MTELILTQPIKQETLFEHTYKDMSLKLTRHDDTHSIIVSLGTLSVRDSIALYHNISKLLKAHMHTNV